MENVGKLQLKQTYNDDKLGFFESVFISALETQLCHSSYLPASCFGSLFLVIH
jgi:hypothetical protein